MTWCIFRTSTDLHFNHFSHTHNTHMHTHTRAHIHTHTYTPTHTHTITEAAPPVRLVRLWPDHFSSRPDYNITCSVVTHNLLMFLVLVVGLPLKLHSSQGLFFPKTAILMLRERFLIAENTCENFFPALHADRSALCTSALQVGRTTSSMPLPPLHHTTYTHIITHAHTHTVMHGSLYLSPILLFIRMVYFPTSTATLCPH